MLITLPQPLQTELDQLMQQGYTRSRYIAHLIETDLARRREEALAKGG